jgi:hypothetical protein
LLFLQDIRFDTSANLDRLRDEALSKYQENAYLLGRLFSVSNKQSGDLIHDEDSSDSDISQDESKQYMNDDQVLGQMVKEVMEKM